MFALRLLRCRPAHSGQRKHAARPRLSALRHLPWLQRLRYWLQRPRCGCRAAAGIALALAATCVAAAPPAPQLALPRVQLHAGMYNIDAQVAASAPEREVGLMGRRQMPANEGMLFVFEQRAGQCFWMKDTMLPLAAAFIADDGTVVNIERMQPLTTDNHCSRAPVRYVLEMHQGWFAKHGVTAGRRIGGGPFAP